jgi:hypothetical protein
MIHIDFSNYPFKSDIVISMPNNSSYGYVNTNKPFSIADLTDFRKDVKWKIQQINNIHNFYLILSISNQLTYLT